MCTSRSHRGGSASSMGDDAHVQRRVPALRRRSCVALRHPAARDRRRPSHGHARTSRVRWRGQDSNLRRTCHAVYSRAPLTAREPRRAAIECSGVTFDAAANGRPGSTSKEAYFGPPSRMPDPPPTLLAGMNPRRPSATRMRSQSHRVAQNRLGEDVRRRAKRSLRRLGWRAVDADETPFAVRDEVTIRAVADWHEDACAAAGKPLHGRGLAQITLRAGMHGTNIRS